MDSKQIFFLAKLLRDNGDKILNSEFKLTLSGLQLKTLNESLTIIADQSDVNISQAFQVSKAKNFKSEIYRDLQLIYDFVQKTPFLCITTFPGEDNFEGPVDISKFRALRYLEVRKFNIKKIINIKPLRAQLEHLMCTKSLNSVEDIITYCGGDNSNGFVWNELKSANFICNGLKTIDHSLEFAQYLQNLNLSHNQLTSVEAVKWLPNLKVLDLGYNCLAKVPALHTDTVNRLQILILSNNFIEDLNGILRLSSLYELDISNNCLLDHQVLLPINSLASLRFLNLSGNPLFYHPKHRQITASYLNQNTANVKLLLDSNQLSNNEKLLVGRYQSGVHLFFTSTSSSISYNRRSTSNQYTSQTATQSLESAESLTLNNSIKNSKKSIKEKKMKIRIVEIEEQGNGSFSSHSKNISSESSDMLVKDAKNDYKINLISSNDHLDVKEQIENLREKYGTNWLQGENAEIMHNALGRMISTHDAIKIKTISQNFIRDLLGKQPFLHEKIDTSNTIQDKSNLSSIYTVQETLCDNQDNSEEIESEAISTNTKEKYLETTWNSNSNDASIKSCKKNIIEAHQLSQVEENSASDSEDNEITYIVYKNDGGDELFLTLSDISIKEKDVLTRKTCMKWSLKILESCERIKPNTIRIYFDTVRKDKKERTYIVEEGLCQELENNLRNVLSKRLSVEINQNFYRCLNCSCQFSREGNMTHAHRRNKSEVYCPVCKSFFVVQKTELEKASLSNNEGNEEIIGTAQVAMFSTLSSIIPKFDNSTNTTAARENHEKSTTPPSSTGSTGSMNESSTCSQVSNFDGLYNPNRDTSANSANEKDTNVALERHWESDVEILSNPSQSSIEILENTNSNCKALEERKLLKPFYLKTIEEQGVKSSCDSNLEKTQIGNTVHSKNIAFKDTPMEIGPELPTMSSGSPKNNVNFYIADDSSETLQTNNIHREKCLTGTMNLAESSSSGSISESVCTAYEQNTKCIPNSPKINNRIGQFYSQTKAMSGDVISNTISSKDNNAKIMQEENSLISTMLSGLSPSINFLMPRNQTSETSNSIAALQCENFNFNYIDFTDVDHRIKLYFYQMKFANEHEHFKWLVRGKIFVENNLRFVDGMVIMSSTKFYLMEIVGPQTSDISKWVRQIYSGVGDKMDSIQLLPWKLGFSIKIKEWGNFLLILQDNSQTNNLLKFFSDTSTELVDIDELNLNEELNTRFRKSIQDEDIQMISIFEKCEVLIGDNIKSLQPTALLATNTHLYLTSSNIAWLSYNSLTNIQFDFSQLISNLVEIDRTSSTIFTMNFIDETQGRSELWKCNFESKESIETSIAVIEKSWKKLFGVSLENT